MSKRKEKADAPLTPEEEVQATPTEQEVNPLQAELDALKTAATEQDDKFLRLAAEYDNYRRRSQKEKENAWADAKGETTAAFFPVYDNLERALKQNTCDEAYRRGVEMTMDGLKAALTSLGIDEIPSLGQTFDPNLHNAVMHVDDEAVGESTIVEVFQTGFKSGDKVLRFAMVKVAN